MPSGQRRAKTAIVACSICACAGAAADVSAADKGAYPTKSIRLIVPFAPGGSNDIMARLIGQKFAESLGQQVVVDNRAGASGIIGTDIAAKAAPDGYTLLMMSLTFTVNPSLFSKLPYDTNRDLTPVTLVASAPLMLVVHPALPTRTVKELIAYARANPGKLSFGSGGRGATPHLAGEMFKLMAGVQMTHVPYKGGGPALVDLVGGQIQLMLENIPSTLPYAKSGKLRALAVTSIKRSALVPDLPTLDEAGLKGYEIVGWNGLFVPAGTSRSIVTRLHGETAKALEQPDMKARLAALGAEGVGSSPEEFKAFVQAEIRKWARVVKDAGLEVQ
jgi:tripartite-type tricarboxylate transporter receptor subunit TctC